MTDRQTRNLEALQQAFEAAGRLADRGLAVNDNGRGLNADGLQTLGDLAAVLMLQTQGRPGRADRVASATARAFLSALSDVIADEPSDGTARLLRDAIKETRQ